MKSPAVSFREYINFVKDNQKYFYEPMGNPVLKYGMDEILRRSKHVDGYTELDEKSDLKYLCDLFEAN
ncbi:hypothetical protein [Pontibacillus salipaludis]|uniref:Uncharacterized protein n=1 Tax=Pontibacillus salipaludis TaxID=1697394 RepID=A0ABQ1PWZ2_9BACI|nr:hypothetical protein [Pontibacillus salipaludis]GGD05494.1 hypothetical protein GCM10011389_11270 [Pontibacillus salipaludis]